MVCEWIEVPGGMAVVCSPGRPGSRTPCSACGKAGSPILCDGPAPADARRKTCDAALCQRCVVHVGKDRDLCPSCARGARQEDLVGATCKSCSAPLIWAEGPTGKMLPVDRDPVPDGNILLFRRPDGTVRAEVLGKGAPRPEGRPLRVSHFLTCPHARQHRRSP